VDRISISWRLGELSQRLRVFDVRADPGGDVAIEVAPQLRKIAQYDGNKEVTTNEGACVARVKSDRPVQVLLSVVTTRDDPRPLERARREIDAAAAEGLAALEAAHRQWWHSFWKRSFVHLEEWPYILDRETHPYEPAPEIMLPSPEAQ
jgi:hypothetical protein